MLSTTLIKRRREIANLMGTLSQVRTPAIIQGVYAETNRHSQYSTGGQFAPRHWFVPHSFAPQRYSNAVLFRSQPATPEPQTSEPEPESTALAVVPPQGPARPGWRTVKPQPKKIHSKVVNTPKALPAPPTPQRMVTPPVHPTPKLPSWTTWKRT